MISRLSGLAAVALLCLVAIPSAADAADPPKGTYFIAADAWTCEGRGAIREAEQRAKNTPLDTPQSAQFQATVGHAHCLPSFGPKPVNVMRVDGDYVYLCDKLRDCLGGSVLCTYALVADIQNGEGHPATRDQLEKAAHGKTMADIKETQPANFDPSECR
jgi:hypothetical protein